MAKQKTKKTGKKVSKQTPMMKQYFELKAKYPNTVLLFRVGDFYETFGEDAVIAADILGIVLTKRHNGAASEIELAGFPHHSLNAYLPKLVRAGKRVAVCDQLEDPKQAKGVVKRGITDVVTPGITQSDDILEHTKNNYLASLFFQNSSHMGAAFVDVSTGDFFCLSGDARRIEKLFYSLNPSEVVVARKDQTAYRELFGEDFYSFRYEDWAFQQEYAEEKLQRHFEVENLKGFGLEGEPAGTVAAGVLLQYLEENEQKNLKHVSRIYRFEDEDYVALDRFTIRNLELLQPMFSDGQSFCDTIDFCATPMGARLLRRWVTFPLRTVADITARQEKVECLLTEDKLREGLLELLKSMPDLERLLGRLATNRLGPREANQLRNALERLAPIREILERTAQAPFSDWLGRLQPVDTPLDLLKDTLLGEPSAVITKGNVIADRVSDELDELRGIRNNAKGFLNEMLETQKRESGITSLKVGYNKVFGYYLEVTNAHKDKVPEHFIRKQTLTNAERYITPELKAFEEKILGAEERMLALEQELYFDLLKQLQVFIEPLQANATLIAELDVLLGFAYAARRYDYCRPKIDDDIVIDIQEGRHPVIEQLLPPDQPYVPNDTRLENDDQQVLLITGPNMVGKSALLRQVALITLMAQIGSYVPAQRARIGLVDKIFTRVGASDNVSAGESTFMVEMSETARIANSATDRSLILLDEIGRGTSTYDGVSIAWALVEYLHNNLGAKTLFATHYHELAELAEQLPRVHNFNVSVKEVNGQILFVRKLQPGHSAHSFGINVAKMAGMPLGVVVRAQELLQTFEGEGREINIEAASEKSQMQLFQVEDATAKRLRELMAGLDVNRLTPIDALLKLHELQQLVREGD